MFEFKVSSKEIQKYFHLEYVEEDIKWKYVLHTINEELYEVVKSISFMATDYITYDNLQIIKPECLSYHYDELIDDVVCVITVDSEEIGMYIKFKYFS